MYEGPKKKNEWKLNNELKKENKREGVSIVWRERKYKFVNSEYMKHPDKFIENLIDLI
jgi:hypothetical protein